jgi:hypothetical protein
MSPATLTARGTTVAGAILALTLAGCAADNLHQGNLAMQRSDVAGAVRSYEACVQKDEDPICMYMLGLIADYSEQRDSAIKWYTAAARYGHTGAVKGLVELEQPVPATDLKLSNLSPKPFCLQTRELSMACM